MATSLQIYAQGDHEAFRAAMDACVAETGVTKPEPGTPPSEQDRAKIKDCLASKGISHPQGGGRRPPMDEATKAAFDECTTSLGLTKPTRDQRPSEEDRAKIKACLEGKGITLPQHRPHGSAE